MRVEDSLHGSSHSYNVGFAFLDNIDDQQLEWFVPDTRGRLPLANGFQNKAAGFQLTIGPS